MKFRIPQYTCSGFQIGKCYKGANEYRNYIWKVTRRKSYSKEHIWCECIKNDLNYLNFNIGGRANVHISHISRELVKEF